MDHCDDRRRGRFSDGYIAKHTDGRSGFIKVLDYSFYLISPDPLEELKAAIDAFSDERRLLTVAKNRRLDRVVEIYEHGELRDSNTKHVSVHFLIFEMAEDDARCQMDSSRRLGAPWCARILHQSAVGLRQLHNHQIAHQDIKPANVLCFNGNLAKLADLGSAVDPSVQAPHVHFEVAGDEMYAPPELLYDWISPEWSIRRYACDLYLLGSLGYAIFTGVSLTPQIIQNLPQELRPDQWRGEYSEVLPYVRHAFNTALEGLRRDPLMASQPQRWQDDMIALIASLTDPDPSLRGDPIARRAGKDPYSLERYVSRLDSLAFRASAAALR